MKIVIVGGGPTGLSLAYYLSKKNHNIYLVEKDNNLGGCWRVHWKDGYYTEHSPKVYSNKYGKSELNEIFKEIGYDIKVKPTYGSTNQTLYKIAKFMLPQFTILDLVKLVVISIYYYFFPTNLTVDQVMKKINISKKGYQAVKIYSILVANSPNKLGFQALVNLGLETNSRLDQFKSHQEWIDLWEKYLIKSNVKIMKNTTAKKIDKLNKTLLLSSGKKIKFDKIILAIPPQALIDFLIKQEKIIKNNFMDSKKLKSWLLNSTYYSIGFQLHYNKSVKFPKDWCWSCNNNFNFIVIDTSRFATKFSKRKNIKTVLSGTIVATDNKVRGKTINQMSLEEIKQEIIKYFGNDFYKLTLTNGLYHEDGIWKSKDCAYALGSKGVFPIKGELDWLYAVGSINHKKITTINIAVNSAKYFVDNYIKK
jgi:protoporphyrinogen oxidase